MRILVLTLLLGGLAWAQGTELVYKMNPEQAVVVRKRLDKFGLKDIDLKAVGEDKFSLHVPAKDKSRLKQIKELITRPGKLEFRITVEKGTPTFDHCWKLFRDAVDAGTGEAKACVIKGRKDSPDGFRWVRVDADTPDLRRRSMKDDKWFSWMLVKLDRMNFTGSELEKVFAWPGGLGGDKTWRVRFDVKADGRRKLARLTKEPGTYLAIILDGRLRQAPEIKATLSKNGELSGYTEDEASVLAAILHAGSFDKPPELVEEKSK